MKTWDSIFKWVMIIIAVIAVITVSFSLLTAASTIDNIIGSGLIVFTIWFVGRYCIKLLKKDGEKS